MLQRVYYTDDPIDQIIADAKAPDEGHRRPVDASRLPATLVAALAGAATTRIGAGGQRLHRPCRRPSPADGQAFARAGSMYATPTATGIGLLYLAPALLFVARLHRLSAHPDDLGVVQQLVDDLRRPNASGSAISPRRSATASSGSRSASR